MKNQKGITLIVLVVTIIVLLILAGVSIATLTGDSGILTQASTAKIENRGAAVQEARNLWEANRRTDEKTNKNTAQTLDELLNDLENQNLITSEEKATIKETGEVTIGSRTIIFEEKVELEACISRESDGTYILVNFKNNNYEIYANKVLEGKSEYEMMQLFVEAEKYYYSDYYEAMYPDEEITLEMLENKYVFNDSLSDLAYRKGHDTISELIIDWEYVKPEGFDFENEKIYGNITDQDGNTVQVDDSTNLRYKVSEDGIYKFSGVTIDGKTAEIEITTNLENEYRLIPIGSIQYGVSKIALVNGFGEFIDIIEEYAPKFKAEGSEEEIDLIPGIYQDEKYGNAIDLWIEGIDGTSGYATVYLMYNGQKIEWRGFYWCIPM